MKKFSATTLAKFNNVEKSEIDKQLTEQGYCYKEQQHWQLTEKGKIAGGEYVERDQYGPYIVWPKDILTANVSVNSTKARTITASEIAKHFDIPIAKINPVLSELGWISKQDRGWLITNQGLVQGGIQAKIKKSGAFYVSWDQSILTNKLLLNSIDECQDGADHASTPLQASNDDFRQKYEASHRCTDGHYVRSKSEMLIDNWLYMAEVIHAYERRVPIEEEMYCDFYLPTGKVYIEFWGYEQSEQYLDRKKLKQKLYRRYGFHLIELKEIDIQNLDDVLPRELLKYNIKTY